METLEIAPLEVTGLKFYLSAPSRDGLETVARAVIDDRVQAGILVSIAEALGVDVTDMDIADAFLDIVLNEGLEVDMGKYTLVIVAEGHSVRDVFDYLGLTVSSVLVALDHFLSDRDHLNPPRTHS